MTTLVTFYVAALSFYHVLTGCISYFAPGAAMRFYRGLYDCNPVEQRHLRIILRPWGALALFAGVAGLAALPDPTRHPLLLSGLALLLAMRMGYRVALRKELREISGIAPRRNWINVGLLATGLAIVLSGLWMSLHRAP